MNHLIGIVWFDDEIVYRKALDVFVDSQNMPDTYEDWQVLVRQQLEQIRYAGNIALRVDFNPERFVDWCSKRGLRADSQARTALGEYGVLEYQKTGKGKIIE